MRQARGITMDRQAFIGVIEVAVIKGITHWQTRDIARWQVLRVRLPLLGCVVTNERLIERTANQRNSLLLEVLRFVDVLLRSLFLDEFPSLIWGVVTAKELVNQPQPHWELVRRAIMHGKYSVLIVGEIRELRDIVQHTRLRGEEKESAV